MKSMPDVIEKRGFVFFWRGWPSQWHPARFTVDGVEYTCAEQFILATKYFIDGWDNYNGGKDPWYWRGGEPPPHIRGANGGGS